MLFGSWRELQAGRTSWNLLKLNGHGLTGIMPAPEQPCSPASSHGRLSFRPVIVTTAHVHAVKPFVTVLSWDEAAIYSLNSTDCGNNLFTPGICKTMKTSSIRHLFGLGGWVGGSPPILSLFGFSEMSDNCRPPLNYIALTFLYLKEITIVYTFYKVLCPSKVTDITVYYYQQSCQNKFLHGSVFWREITMHCNTCIFWETNLLWCVTLQLIYAYKRGHLPDIPSGRAGKTCMEIYMPTKRLCYWARGIRYNFKFKPPTFLLPDSIRLAVTGPSDFGVGSRGAALSERKVASSTPTIGDFHTVGPWKKTVFASATSYLYIYLHSEESEPKRRSTVSWSLHSVTVNCHSVTVSQCGTWWLHFISSGIDWRNGENGHSAWGRAALVPLLLCSLPFAADQHETCCGLVQILWLERAWTGKLINFRRIG